MALPLRVVVLALALLAGAAAGAQANGAMDAGLLARASDRANGLPRLHAMIVARDGKAVLARAFRGPGLDAPVNIKSASKSVISALVGIAIDRGVLKGPDQPVAPLLARRLPAERDPRLARVTIGNLLSMQAGLERTSGRNYGRWVQSRDWVRHALSRPFVDEPGGQMLYSTGNTHLLSAILTAATGRSTLDLARDWLGAPLGIDIPPWQTDPQGLYLGGNNMLLSPRGLLRFGELYRNGGVHEGRRILPESWIAESWTPRTRSRFSGDGYGYGWFVDRACGYEMPYARGFGGQFLYIVPALGLTVAITSDISTRTRVGGYREQLAALIRDDIVPAALAADGKGCEAGE